MISVIISGGGTGGHIFPALAIADALKAAVADIDILFVGASGKMEMDRVPAAGYRIVGLPVTGFQRRMTWKNLVFPFKLAGSMMKAWQVVSKFKPDMVIGVGGYASGPVLRVAIKKGIPALLQEQNSYPGITNRLLAGKVQKICVAYQGMSAWFPEKKIIMTGNPVRKHVTEIGGKRREALDFFKLEADRKTVLIIGGSLGAGTINTAIRKFIQQPDTSGRAAMDDQAGMSHGQIQVLWQTGSYYYDNIRNLVSGSLHEHASAPGSTPVKTRPGEYNYGKDNNPESGEAIPSAILVRILPFIDRMDLAYAAADLIVSRAGAIAIAELCLISKPVILVPSPNVAEDHQTKNASALEKAGAALMVRDADAADHLGITIMTTLKNEALQTTLGRNIRSLGIEDAATRIAHEALEMIQCKPDTDAGGKLRRIYFLGIGGIGMSSLARYFVMQGASVYGYDRTPTPLTDQLTGEGMKIHFSEDISQIPEGIDMVVFTPAVPSDHKEMIHFRSGRIPIKKRAEVLGMISKRYKTVAVAGTHGKTTTSTLIAHMVASSGLDHIAFLGGISKNYGSNFLYRFGSKPAPVCIVEADEFDRSFLQLSPEIAIVTSVDADHLDIYGDHQELQANFRAFADKVKPEGHLIAKVSTGLETGTSSGARVHSYSLDSGGSISASSIRIIDHLFHFDLVTGDRIIHDFTLGIPGRFNLENAVAALAACLLLGIPDDDLREALKTYRGVQRRFDYHINRADQVYIDDYAHHPEELKACILAVRELYPGKQITGIFQPHLYSRTRDFADEFARSLALLDELILLEIYPAREKPIPGITSGMLLDLIPLKNKRLVAKDHLVETLAKSRHEIVLTLGAGDIDQLVQPVKEILGRD